MKKHRVKHRVKHHNWVNGQLQTIEHFFETLEEAMENAQSSTAQTVKIYDENGELQHSITPAATSVTYA
jgi:predicted RNase H-like HicB family nuclease